MAKEGPSALAVGKPVTSLATCWPNAGKLAANGYTRNEVTQRNVATQWKAPIAEAADPGTKTMKNLLDKLTAMGPFQASKTAQVLLKARYLRPDPHSGAAESTEHLFGRVADHVALAEPAGRRHEVANAFSLMMRSRCFLPNSPTLMNAGTDSGALSACFVLPISETSDQIEAQTILIQRSGGGTGFSFSTLTEDQDPLAWIARLDRATDSIRQVGLRRGANMAVLAVDHPSLLQFVTAKTDPSRLVNFNLSVAVTHAFMQTVLDHGRFDLHNPRTKDIVTSLDADRALHLMAQMAWLTGEPGMLFLDRINETNPTPHLGTIESTNPCGEQPLLPYESCNLGSINLARFVTEAGDLDWPFLAQVVRLAIRFLDDVIETNQYPIDEVRRQTLLTRKVGLGVMGFADALILLGVPYQSAHAGTWAERIMRFVAEESKRASNELAKERGTFPEFERSTLASGPPVRNATTNTIAPTGSISILADCSSGIEPLYALAMRRLILGDQQTKEISPLLVPMAARFGIDPESVVARVQDSGSFDEAHDLPPEFVALFRTAHEIPWQQHLRVQAAFQKYVDNSVSKTINFPRQATARDVYSAFLLADRLGCKGVTVYRDGSRTGQILEKGLTQPIEMQQPTGGTQKAGPCPECGTTLNMTGPCRWCMHCAWSRCDEAPRSPTTLNRANEPENRKHP